MMSMSFFLVSTLLIVGQDLPKARGLPGLGDIQTYVNFAFDAVGVIKGDLPITALLTGSTGPTLDKVIESIDGISEKLDNFGDQFRAQLDAQSERFDKRFDEINAKLDKILTDIPLEGKINSMTRELHSYMVRVDRLYAKYERYSVSRENFNNFTIKNFIEAATSDRRGDLDDVITRMFALLVPERSNGVTDGILDVMALQMTNIGESICGTKNSAQMYLFEMYEAIMITETRGFVMSIFAYALISVFKRTSFNSELDYLRDEFVKRSDSYLKITSKSIRGIPRQIELCDAKQYVEGVEYFKIESLDHTLSDKGRAISRMMRKTDITNNMVMSGIRFVNKNDKLIEYQLQQARLLPNGMIDNRNQSWVELPHVTFGTHRNNIRSYNFDNNSRTAYWTLSIHEPLIAMDDVILPRDYVAAGFMLARYEKAIVPVVFGVKFDFVTGKLNPKDTIWQRSSYVYKESDYRGYEKVRRMLPPEAPVNHVDSKPPQAIQMGYPPEGKSPISPYFDARSVDSKSLGWALSGVGLFHRGYKGYGGYFNFRLLTIDLTDYTKF